MIWLTFLFGFCLLASSIHGVLFLLLLNFNNFLPLYDLHPHFFLIGLFSVGNISSSYIFAFVYFFFDWIIKPTYLLFFLFMLHCHMIIHQYLRLVFLNNYSEVLQKSKFLQNTENMFYKYVLRARYWRVSWGNGHEDRLDTVVYIL